MGGRSQRRADARGFRPAGNPFATAANPQSGSVVASRHLFLRGGAEGVLRCLCLACGLFLLMIAEQLDGNYVFRKEKYALRLVDLLYEALLFI